MIRTTLCALLLAAMMSVASAADSGPYVFEFEELTPGVWAGVRPDSTRPPVMGNATFVVSDEGVVVFDGGGMPAMADQVIEKIRAITDAPVTHVVISHWHGDHNFGIGQFVQAFPDVEIVAHEFTRDVFNSTRINYIDQQRNFKELILPRLQEIVDTRALPDGTAIIDLDVAIYQRLIDDADLLEAEARRARVTPPTKVMDDDYVIESGERRIELKFLGLVARKSSLEKLTRRQPWKSARKTGSFSRFVNRIRSRASSARSRAGNTCLTYVSEPPTSPGTRNSVLTPTLTGHAFHHPTRDPYWPPTRLVSDVTPSCCNSQRYPTGRTGE